MLNLPNLNTGKSIEEAAKNEAVTAGAVWVWGMGFVIGPTNGGAYAASNGFIVSRVQTKHFLTHAGSNNVSLRHRMARKWGL